MKFGDAPPGVCDLVSDQVSYAVAFDGRVGSRTDQQSMNFPESEAQGLRPKEELYSADRFWLVDAVPGVAPRRGIEQAHPFVVAEGRGGHTDEPGQLSHTDPVMVHVGETTA